LIQGDISKSVLSFVERNSLWDRVSSGGIVVFDEYAYHNWSESIGVDKFFKDKNVKIKSLDFVAPSAYVIKP
jgi:hypothetical protein